MSNTIEYKGYVGNIEFSEKDGIFYSKGISVYCDDSSSIYAALVIKTTSIIHTSWISFSDLE